MNGNSLRNRTAGLLPVLLLCACGRPAGGDAGHAPPPPAMPAETRAAVAPLFEDAQLGLRVPPVAGMQARTDFRRDYLAADAWRADAAPGERGTPLLALVLDGSDEVTAAELRIGSSDTAAALAACEAAPEYARPEGGETVELDGVPFRRFAWSDAAMSHYLEVEAYRAVRGDRCLAIDLLVAGTRPEVYDPPRTPPFDTAQARAKLREALAAIRLAPPSP